jgi:DNA-binding transcriptional MocR family regulator
VLKALVSHPHFSQRQLASITELSLGTINHILKQLLHMGYLSVSKMKTGKSKMIVSAQAFLEMNRYSHISSLSVVKAYQELRDKIYERLMSLVDQGYKDFIVPFSHDGLYELISNIVSEKIGDRVTLKNQIVGSAPDTILIGMGMTNTPVNFKGRTVDLFSELFLTDSVETT